MTLSKKATRRKYDSTFKEDVIKMLASGRSTAEVAKALGISSSLILRWYKSSPYKQTAVDKKGLPFPPAIDASFTEIERLKTELRRTEQERDILKKALGIFSRGI
jgi:transposase